MNVTVHDQFHPGDRVRIVHGVERDGRAEFATDYEIRAVDECSSVTFAGVNLRHDVTVVIDRVAADGETGVVWQLDHDGRGRTFHATDEHAKAWAEEHEPDGDTYWRWDDGTHWLKRHGETIATIRRVELLGPAPIDARHQ